MMTRILKKKPILGFIAIIISIGTYSKDLYWINDSGDWNDGNHWSLSSGGLPSGDVPGISDNVIFDDNSFTIEYPQIYIDQPAQSKDFSVSSTTAVPSFRGIGSDLTIHGNFLVAGRINIYFPSGKELKFVNETNQPKSINTNGIALHTDVSIDGKWVFDNHFILSYNNILSVHSGTLQSNQHTIHAYRILINDDEVKTDFTGSYVSAMDGFDLSATINTGGDAQFHTTTGDLTNIDKGGFANSNSSWLKTTVMCSPPADPLQLDLDVTSNYNGADISCKDSCDGELTITASGTPGPFSYSFEFNPATGQTIYSGLCVGSYTVTVTDSSNLIAPGFYAQCVIQEQVSEPFAVTVLLGPITDPSCPNICDGSTFVVPGGGTGALSVFWPLSGETTTNPVGLCTGVNPLEVTDQNGCQLDSFVVVTDPPPIFAPATITPPSCNGFCDAEIDIAPVGGNGGPYTYNWITIPLVSGQGSNPGIGFCSGSIDVNVFDVDGCQYDTTYVILDPPILTVSAAVVSDALCNGSCDGQASANGVGGVPSYTYEWFTSPGNISVSTDQNPNTLCAGDYYVVVTDASGCTATSAVITIGEPTPLSSTADAYDVSCFGVCDGAVDVDVSGGTPAYSYSWQTFPGLIGVGASDSISGLCPGQYQITVTDANGCVDGPIIVEVFEPLQLTVVVTGTDPTCYDLCDGSALAVPAGGVPGYSYTWSPLPPIGGATDNPSSMCDGTYDLTVTDANGCTVLDQVTLTNPGQYDITTSQIDLACFGMNNGEASVTVNSGGSGVGYTYTWAPIPPVGQGTPSASGLTAGVWCVTVSDDQLCDTTICFTITSPPQLTANASVISQASCFGDCNGSAQVVIAGGTPAYTILWNPGGQNGAVASNLCAGNYTVDVTDANGCTANDAITITEPTQFDITSNQIDNLCFGDCNGQASVVVNSGGTAPYTYSWDDPLNQVAATAIGLCAGPVNVTITDNNLCDTIIPFTILEPTEIVIDTNFINSACFGSCDGAAWITVVGGTGGYTYEWFDAATGLALGNNNDSILTLCPGDYYASVQDANGCVVLSDTITISELPQIFASVVSFTDATCGICDGTAEVTAAGGTGNFTYTWTPAPGVGQGSSIVSGLCAGVYNVDIVDDAGCSVPLNVTINSVALEVLSMDSVNVSCFGLCDGQALVTYNVLDPPYVVEWFDYATGLPLGIIDNPASNPSTATGLCAGTYTAVVTNNSGCVTSDTVSVFEPPQITAVLTPSDVTCNGLCDGTISAAASGGTGPFTYVWNPLPGSGQGTPNVSGLCAGNWDVTITDAMGCSQNFVTTISEPVVLLINTEISTAISCFGANDGTATVTVVGGLPAYSYDWIDCNTGLPIGQNAQQAINLGPGSYQCVVTDNNGCTVTSSCLAVVEPNQISGTINTSLISCYGDCDGMIDVIPAGGTSPYFYQWEDEFNNPLPGQTNDTMSNVCQGIYNVTVTDFNGCSTTLGPVDLTSPNAPWDITASQTNVTCSGSCDGTAGVVVLAGNNPPYTYQWDDVPLSTTPNVSNLCAGVYNVIVSDAGVCDTTISFTIIDNPPVMANPAITNVLCFGECTGQITVSPFGGVGPYTVTWSDGQVGTTATGLCSGPITCSITDGIGCTKDTIINITEPTQLIANSVFSNPATCAVCNGSATVNVLGGVPGYTYVWTPDPFTCCGGVGQGTNSVAGLCAGVYSVDVTDANGCVLTEVFPVSDINGEVINMVTNDASCFGTCDGDADAQYVCSDPTCTNQWYDGATGVAIPGETNSTIANLCAGDYFIEVVNNSGCTTVVPVTIGSPTQIIANEVITPITCSGNSDASIVVAPSGGSGAGYSYAWNPVPPNGDGTNSALNIGAGTWDLTITDGSGCSEIFSFNIVDPGPIILSPPPTVVNASCFGSCDGSILIGVSGGYGGYSYQWYSGGVPLPGETSPLITNLCAGFYDVEVTDIGGCTVTFPNIPISDPIPISGPISGTDITCNGQCDGTVTVVPAGGIPPYTINWYDAATMTLIGQTGSMATNLCQGDYYAVITDANGCNFTSNTQSVAEPAALTYTLTSTNVTCFGFCDGSADMAMGGGTPPYTYIWLDILGNPVPGGGGQTILNLCTGNYTIEVVDANGCSTGQQPLVITGFAQITGSTFSNDATCGVADGNATVFANGGNPPYTYQWMDATLVPIIGETNNVLLNVVAGTYYVEVTDANGCSDVFQAIISNLPSTTLTWDNVVNPSCAGSADGSIDITAVGVNPPLTYSWNPGGIIAEDPSGLTAGTWTLTITDALGCINVYDTILVDPAPIVISSVVTPSDCGLCNGTADLTISGGTGATSVIWNNGLVGEPVAGLCAGVYEAQVTDANGCVMVEPITINNASGLTAFTVPFAISCAGSCDGQITVSGTGGTTPYTYLWLHDGSTAQTASNLCAGTYYCQVTDSVGCTWTEEIELLDPNPIVDDPTIQNPNCLAADGSITVLTSGGNLPHTYLWNTGSTSNSIGGLPAGTYTLTVTDASGCQMDFVYGLSDLNAAAIDLIATDVQCYNACDGTIDTLSLTGGNPAFTFQWYDGLTGVVLPGETNPLISNLCEGDYMLEVTDALGCISYQAGTIIQPDTILLNPLFLIDPTCNGLCNGEIIANPIGGTLPFTFLWDDPGLQTVIHPLGLCGGTYTITVTDANGCQVQQSGDLIEPTAITIVQDSITDATCVNSTDGEIYITVSGGIPGYNYQWVSQTAVDTFLIEDITGLLPMEYYLTVTDQNGCTAMDTATVDTLLIVIADAGLDSLLCFGNGLTIIGLSNIPSGADYTWYDTSGVMITDTSELILLGTSAGTMDYILEVYYAGCTSTDTVSISTTDSIWVDAGIDIEMYPTETEMIGGVPTTDINNTVLWNPGIYLDDSTTFNPLVIEPIMSTTYYVTATDTNGCTVIDSMYVEVLPEIVIPDGISPNADGKNETWILDFLDQYPGTPVLIQVYNRWGELLFESDENYADDWGGTTKDGKRLPAGTYYYIIDIDHEDFPKPFTGPITIMW